LSGPSTVLFTIYQNGAKNFKNCTQICATLYRTRPAHGPEIQGPKHPQSIKFILESFLLFFSKNNKIKILTKSNFFLVQITAQTINYVNILPKVPKNINVLSNDKNIIHKIIKKNVK
jgi:hypothetical protein